MKTVTKDDLVKMGYPLGTAQSIIREAKCKLVNKGVSFYKNKRVGRVPLHVVEEILGTLIPEVS